MRYLPCRLDALSLWWKPGGAKCVPLGIWFAFGKEVGRQFRVGTFDALAFDEVSSYEAAISDPERFVAREALDFIDNVTLPGDHCGPTRGLVSAGRELQRTDNGASETALGGDDGDAWSSGTLSVSGDELDSLTIDREGWRVSISKPNAQLLVAVIGPRTLFANDSVMLSQLDAAEAVTGVQVDRGPIDRLDVAAQVRSWRGTLVQPIRAYTRE